MKDDCVGLGGALVAHSGCVLPSCGDQPQVCPLPRTVALHQSVLKDSVVADAVVGMCELDVAPFLDPLRTVLGLEMRGVREHVYVAIDGGRGK